MSSYSIIYDNGKVGLSYTEIEYETIHRNLKPSRRVVNILLPKYNSIELCFKDQDIETLFSEKKDSLNKNYISILEDGFNAVIADGKCGLLYSGNIFTGLVFDRILKLSYRHYLCMAQAFFTIYRFEAFGFNSNGLNDFFIKTPDIQCGENPNLEKVLSLLSHKYPEVYEDVLKHLKSDGSGNYISEYNYFTAYFDDFYSEWAIQRAMMDKDFEIKILDINYGVWALE